jgi:hypothetical protein
MKTKVSKGQLLVQNTVVSFTRIQQGDFISLTDIAKVKNPDEPKDVVKNWLRSRSTLDFLGLWEQINNPNFKGVEFDSFKTQAGTNSFTLSPSKWIEATGAIGIRSTAGRTGGTYAHQDIAFEFASWVSAEFKLYLIKEFQRLKNDEIQAKSLEWNLTRSLSKINYRIHTDAIAEDIIPQALTKQQSGLVYASEDFVIATGVQYSVRQFIEKTAAALGMQMRWEGTGVDEVGYWTPTKSSVQSPQSSSEPVVRIDPRYFRPTEVETLLGDPTKAKQKLGWVPEITLDQMIEEMAATDLAEAKKHALLKKHGYDVSVSVE